MKATCQFCKQTITNKKNWAEDKLLDKNTHEVISCCRGCLNFIVAWGKERR